MSNELVTTKPEVLQKVGLSAARPDGPTAGNMDIWDRVYATDQDHTKRLTTGARLTSVNAFYIVKKLTETFGPCGDGWGFYEVESKVESGVWFVRVVFWYRKSDGAIGEITQWGGCELKDKYDRTDSDAPKKATTDAWKKCASLLGFGGDVHMGQHDDKNYLRELAEETEKNKRAEKERKRKRLEAASQETPGHVADVAKPPQAPKTDSVKYAYTHMSRWKGRDIVTGDDWTAYRVDLLNEVAEIVQSFPLSPRIGELIKPLVLSMESRHPSISGIQYADDVQAIGRWRRLADELIRECRKHNVKQEPKEPQPVTTSGQADSQEPTQSVATD